MPLNTNSENVIAVSPSAVRAAAVVGANLATSPIPFPQDFMISVKTYGAVGDGATDDTAAIQRALSDGRSDTSMDYYGRPKALYFPPGTYLVHDTLQWNGCCVTLQGAGSSSSVIRLAPNSNGFNNPTVPRPVILTPLGNQSFRQNLWDLGIRIGSNNPGATALNYVSNNSGAVHNVLITSEDRKGHAGVDLTRQYAGPLLLKNVQIQGFDVGIDLANAEYGSTFEGITLENQQIAGIRNVNQPINIRSLVSTNSVPAITNDKGFVVLLDASLGGGSPAYSAVQTNSTAYLRNVSSSGYKATLQNSVGASVSLTQGTITEYLAGSPTRYSPSGATKAASLKLDVAETPSYTSTDLSDWAAFNPNWYGDTNGLQAVLNSGKHTIYFPFKPYFSWAEAQVTVPDTVNRIVGFSSIINGAAEGTNGGGIRLIVTSNSTQPLIIEQFGYGLKVDHRGSRPVVIKDAGVSYTSSPGAGKLLLEDVEMGSFAIQAGQQVWARQLNDEAQGKKISNNGGSLWILGLKTEQAGTVIDTGAGGKTELLGGLIYPSTLVPSTDVAFRSTDSQVSYMYTESVYCQGCGYSIQVQQTLSGKTAQITSPANSNFRMPLYVGYK